MTGLECSCWLDGRRFYVWFLRWYHRLVVSFISSFASVLLFEMGNSLVKMCHLRFVTYSAELVLLNKHQIWRGAAKLDCYLKMSYIQQSDDDCTPVNARSLQKICLKFWKYCEEDQALESVSGFLQCSFSSHSKEKILVFEARSVFDILPWRWYSAR